MSVLVITGSARQDSFTRQLGAVIVAAAPDAALAQRLTDLPYFDQDLEATPPAVVEALRAQVTAADAVIFISPEYNGTISGLLGNTIDWLSRPLGDRPAALAGKPVLAVTASPGGFGGVRALVALRTVLGNAGAALLDTTLSVSEVHARLEAGDTDLSAVLEALASLPVAAEPLVA